MFYYVLHSHLFWYKSGTNRDINLKITMCNKKALSCVGITMGQIFPLPSWKSVAISASNRVTEFLKKNSHGQPIWDRLLSNVLYIIVVYYFYAIIFIAASNIQWGTFLQTMSILSWPKLSIIIKQLFLLCMDFSWI